MDSARIQAIIFKNLIPILLGSFGLFLVILGIGQIMLQRKEDEPVVFEEASEKSSDQAIVDVEGAVISPGVYSLNSKSRTVDALAAAGGLSQDADRDWVEKNINLAKVVSDGLKIYIPRLGEQVLSDSSGVSSENPGPVLNINTASVSDLDRLPGVGEVTSQKIIENRPYVDIDDLVSRKIIGQAIFDKIKNKITAN